MPDFCPTLRMDPDRPDRSGILQAAELIRSGGLVIFPTRCLYGIGATALDSSAVERVFRLKQRPPDNPILILVPDPSHIRDLACRVSETAERLMDTFWPGGLTLICQAAGQVPEILTAGTGRIGIRVPSHPVARALVQTLDFPITGTSANISGQPGCSRIDHLHPAVAAGAGLILDAGPLAGGAGSTVVDTTVDPVRIIREGVIPAHEIFKALGLAVSTP